MLKEVMLKQATNLRAKSQTLNSWKEIAGYLDRGVRTAQRWERDLQMPVRRPRGRRRSAVFAIRQEIDAWLSQCPQGIMDEELDTVLTAKEVEHLLLATES